MDVNALMVKGILRTELNSSSGEDDPLGGTRHRGAFIITIEVLCVIFAILNLFGNTLNICAILRFQRLRSVVSHLFLVSLSAADLLLVPTLVLFPIRIHGPVTEASVRAHLVTVQWPGFVSPHLSMLTLLLIAIDRLLAVTKVTKYKSLMTSTVAKVMIIFSWTYVVGFTGVTVLYCGLTTDPSALISDHSFTAWMPKVAVYFAIAQIYVNVTLTCIIYVVIFFLLQRRHRTVSNSTTGIIDIRVERSAHRVKKVTKMMSLIVLVILVTWLPINIFTSVSSPAQQPHFFAIYYSLHLLLGSNTWVNPMVYSWQNQDFRNAYASLLRLRCRKTKVVNLEPDNTVVSHISG